MVITRTPMRISFFGGGTDIPQWYKEHGGSVLSTTIDKYLYITCRYMPPFWDFKNRFVYGSRTEIVNDIEDTEHPSIRETIKFMNIDKGLDIHYNTDVPARSGIGSSSSFTVGLLHALYGQTGKIVSKRRLASEAIHIEQDLIGEAVGDQDQVAAAFGGLNHIIFKKGDGFEVTPMTIPTKRIQELNDHLVLLFTGVQRFASGIEEDKISKMANHEQELSKIQGYVSEAVDILNTNVPIEEFGSLLHETWLHKRNLSNRVTSTEIDNIYEIARANGAIGGKLLGAGGGGFMLFFVRPCDKERLLKSIPNYHHTPFSFDNSGSQVIYYREGV